MSTTTSHFETGNKKADSAIMNEHGDVGGDTTMTGGGGGGDSAATPTAPGNSGAKAATARAGRNHLKRQFTPYPAVGRGGGPHSAYLGERSHEKPNTGRSE
jgi:hypothetical protein